MKASDVLPLIQAAVARYLDGHEPFDTAAQRLATVMRDSLTNKTALPAEKQPGARFAGALTLAPGRPAADQAKASELYAAAFRLLMQSVNRPPN